MCYWNASYKLLSGYTQHGLKACLTNRTIKFPSPLQAEETWLFHGRFPADAPGFIVLIRQGAIKTELQSIILD